MTMSSPATFSENPNMADYLKTMFFETSKKTDNQPQPSQEATDLLVIGAGLPRTGTGSLYAALKQIGLKPYHMKDIMEVPGQVEMWSEFMTSYKREYEMQTGSMSNDVDSNHADTSLHVCYDTLDKVLDDLASNGYMASLDGPLCFFYNELMQRYPKAKVILTVRPGPNPGESWSTSCLQTVFNLQRNTFHVPWNLSSKSQHMVQMGKAIMDLFFPTLDPQTEMPDANQLPGVYYNHVEKVKASVPDDRLLILDATSNDAWKLLCEFVSPISTEIHDSCESILQSNIAYPYVNDKVPMMMVAFMMRSVTIFIKYVMPLSLLGLLVRRWGLFRSSLLKNHTIKGSHVKKIA